MMFKGASCVSWTELTLKAPDLCIQSQTPSAGVAAGCKPPASKAFHAETSNPKRMTSQF